MRSVCWRMGGGGGGSSKGVSAANVTARERASDGRRTASHRPLHRARPTVRLRRPDPKHHRPPRPRKHAASPWQTPKTKHRFMTLCPTFPITFSRCKIWFIRLKRTWQLDAGKYGCRVALGGCPPRAPTDPYVLALEHTVPRIMGSLRDCRPSGQSEPGEADIASGAD